MRETDTIALCVLFLFSSSSFIQAEDDSLTTLQNFSMPSTSSPSQRSSTAKPESLSRPTLFSTSSDGDSRAAADLSANDTLSQHYNDTANSTVAPGAAGTSVNTLAPMNSTSVPGNLTDSQGGEHLSDGNNQMSTTSNTTLFTTATTILTKVKPKTSTSAPFTRSQTLSAPTRPWIITSTSATTTQVTRKPSTVISTGTPDSTTTATTTTTKATTSTTTTTTTTTQTTEFSSTPVLAKARVDNPSELNVGDDTEYSATSVDPLLAGLVSVFVVTAVIVALLIFLKFRHRNERPEFRRLQDLPMDDMMEDTPLSMYSY